MSLTHSLTEPIKELERAYQFFNERLFSNALNEKVILTIQTRGRRQNALAWYWQKRWNATNDGKDEVINEINFSAETLRSNDPYESLIHEMVHHYCAIKNIKDCSRNGKYHNNRFKEAAESVGLLCKKDSSIGWAFTSLGDKALKAKAELCVKPEVFNYLRKEELVQNRKKKLQKWSCLCYSFWSESNNKIKAVCLSCGQEFVDG